MDANNVYFVLASYIIIYESKSELEAQKFQKQVLSIKMTNWLKKSGIDPSNCSDSQKIQIEDSFNRLKRLFRVISFEECREKLPDIYEYHVVSSILEHTTDIPEENQLKEEKVS